MYHARREIAHRGGGRTIMAWTSDLLSKPGFRKGAIAGISVVLAYALFGFLALPGILKDRLEKTVSESIHRTASVREVRANPFDLSVTLRDLSIGERDAPGTWISAGEI